MSKDTTRDAERVRLEVLARIPAEERLREALALSQVVADLAALGAADRSTREVTSER